MVATPVNAYAESPREMSPSAFSGDGESTYTGNPNAGKVMRIKRVVSLQSKFCEISWLMRFPAPW